MRRPFILQNREQKARERKELREYVRSLKDKFLLGLQDYFDSMLNGAYRLSFHPLSNPRTVRKEIDEFLSAYEMFAQLSEG